MFPELGPTHFAVLGDQKLARAVEVGPRCVVLRADISRKDRSFVSAVLNTTSAVSERARADLRSSAAPGRLREEGASNAAPALTRALCLRFAMSVAVEDVRRWERRAGHEPSGCGRSQESPQSRRATRSEAGST